MRMTSGYSSSPAPGLAVPAADDLADRHVVVVRPPAGQVVKALDAVAAVLVLERAPVDEADLAAHGLAALEVGDVDALDAADRLVEPEGFLQALGARLRVDVAQLGLGLPAVARDRRARRAARSP
jgi:hypothetical protein